MSLDCCVRIVYLEQLGEETAVNVAYKKMNQIPAFPGTAGGSDYTYFMGSADLLFSVSLLQQPLLYLHR
jgi:hypothetical protein